MKIDRTNFTGIDARPLKSVILRDISADKRFEKLIKELTIIGQKNGFDVFVQDAKKIVCGQNYNHQESIPLPNKHPYPWSQDNLTFTPTGQLLGTATICDLNKDIAKLTNRNLKKIRQHYAGGNLYFIKDNDGDSLIIGKNELPAEMGNFAKKYFNIKHIYPISQPDFHIDLGIRPLNNKVVLVNDENLTLVLICQAMEKAKAFAIKYKDSAMSRVYQSLAMIKEVFAEKMTANVYKDRHKITKELMEYDFKVVRVPSNVYYAPPLQKSSKENSYLANYMNAIVHVNNEGDLVYITNKSSLDEIAEITPEVELKIGFSFKKMFTDALKGLIKEENIHFVDGNGYISNTLELSNGGIHCLCAEVPKL